MNGGIIYLNNEVSELLVNSLYDDVSEINYKDAYKYFSDVVDTCKLCVWSGKGSGQGLSVNQTVSVLIQKQTLLSTGQNIIAFSLQNYNFLVQEDNPDKIKVIRGD